MRKLFLLGCARSGTTMIRKLLNSHDSINILPETAFYDRLWSARKLILGPLCLDSLNRDEQIKLLYYALYQSHDPNMKEYKVYYSSLVEEISEINTKMSFSDFFDFIVDMLSREIKATCVISGEKTPRHSFFTYKLIENHADDMFIVIVRDPRSVVASMIGRGDLKLNDIRSASAEYCYSYKKIISVLSDENSNVKFLKYEDFVLNSEVEMDLLAGFLSINNDFDVVNLSNNSSFYSSKVTGINKNSVDTWINNLTESEVQEIESYCFELMNIFGYKPRSNVKTNKFNYKLVKYEIHHILSKVGLRPITAWLKK
jgi:hypothetical protein